jgi:hypothetical protein
MQQQADLVQEHACLTLSDRAHRGRRGRVGELKVAARFAELAQTIERDRQSDGRISRHGLIPLPERIESGVCGSLVPNLVGCNVIG